MTMTRRQKAQDAQQARQEAQEAILEREAAKTRPEAIIAESDAILRELRRESVQAEFGGHVARHKALLDNNAQAGNDFQRALAIALSAVVQLTAPADALAASFNNALSFADDAISTVSEIALEAAGTANQAIDRETPGWSPEKAASDKATAVVYAIYAEILNPTEDYDAQRATDAAVQAARSVRR